MRDINFFRFFKRKPKVILATEPVLNFDDNRLKRGNCYLVKEQKPKESFEFFTARIKGVCEECAKMQAFPCEIIGCAECTLFCPCKQCRQTRAQGLCFTTNPPEEIREKYLLQTTPIFWISKHGDKSINPAQLEIMASMINQFFKISKNPIVLLDGIEYLVITNGFTSVLKFLHDIREWAVLHKSIFILPVYPAAFDEKELALIERNMELMA